MLSVMNYSGGMADDQKGRFIQYLAEQNQEHILTKKAMQLVFENFVSQQKVLEERMVHLKPGSWDMSRN